MYLLYLIVGFFAFLGVVLFIKEIVLSFLLVKDTCCSAHLLIVIKNSSKNQIEFETKIALSRLRWYNRKGYKNLYVVGSGLTDENFKICEAICKRFDVDLMDVTELSETLKKEGGIYE